MGARFLVSRALRAVTVTALLFGSALVATAPRAASVTTCNGLTVTIQGTAASQTINGTAGNDVIDSGGGNDIINAGAGNDTICAGTGNDTIDGNVGIDTVSFEKTAAVNANLTTGTATGPGTDTLTGVENLTGSPNSDTLTGDANANTIKGGLGNDTMNGMAGADTASFAGGAAVNANLTAGTATGQGSDTLAGFENLTGSSFNDTLTGDANANFINGGLGNDTMDGMGSTSDTASFAGGAAVTANLTTGTATGQGSDTLANFENLTGSSFNDTLTGNAVNNVITGGLGNDTMDGQGGTGDTASFAGGAAVNANLTTGTAAGQGSDTLANFENLTGSSFNDTLTGNAVNNVITGGLGNDTMDGQGGTGDTASFAGGAAVNANLTTGTATGQGSDTLANFENLTGSSFNDTLTGNAAVNFISAGAGTDTCTTGGANDHVVDCEIDNGSINPAGSVVKYDFTFAASQKLYLDSTAYNPAPGKNLLWSLAGPGGAVFSNQSVALDFDTFAITSPHTAGVYTLTVNGQGGTDTGTHSFRMWTVVDTTSAITPTAGGAVRPINITTPGQRNLFTFTGAVNQYVSVNLTSPAWNHNDCGSRIRLIKPNTTELSSAGFCPAGFLDSIKLDAAGTWTIAVDPGGDSTGTATLTVYNVVDQAANITPTAGGVTNAVNLATPGQNAVFSFTGSPGQKYSFSLTAPTFPDDCSDRIRLIRPDASERTSAGWCGGTGFIDAPTLDGASSGTWRVVVDPNGFDTGTATLKSYRVTDQTANITPTTGGVTNAVSITTPGQNAVFSFTATSGQQFFFNLTGSTFPADCNDRIRLLDASGNELPSGEASFSCGASTWFDTYKVTSTGTFKIEVDAAGTDLGTATLHSYLVVDQTGAITVNGASKPVTITTPGQRTVYSFSGTNGTTVSSHFTGGTFPADCNDRIRLIAPNGVELTEAGLNPCSTTGTLSGAVLNSTGTWSIVFDPAGPDTGTGTIDVTSP